MSAIQFSIDRPFGVYLWDYFDQLYTAVVGKSATDFAFVEGETPLSTVPEGKKQWPTWRTTTTTMKGIKDTLL